MFEVDPTQPERNVDADAAHGARPLRPRSRGDRPAHRHRVPDRGRRQPQRARLPVPAERAAARPRLAARRRRAAGDAVHRRRHVRARPVRLLRARHGAAASGGSRAGPAGGDGLDPHAAARGHAEPQVRGRVVGRRRRPTSCARSPATPTARSASTTARCGATTRRAARSRWRSTSASTPTTASDNPDGPDNITVSPWGGLILAEDGEGVQHLLAVTPDGETRRRSPATPATTASSPASRSPPTAGRCSPTCRSRRHVRHHRTVPRARARRLSVLPAWPAAGGRQVGAAAAWRTGRRAARLPVRAAVLQPCRRRKDHGSLHGRGTRGFTSTSSRRHLRVRTVKDASSAGPCSPSPRGTGRSAATRPRCS